MADPDPSEARPGHNQGVTMMHTRGHPATSIATAHTPADKPITFHIDTGPSATAHDTAHPDLRATPITG